MMMRKETFIPAGGGLYLTMSQALYPERRESPLEAIAARLRKGQYLAIFPENDFPEGRWTVAIDDEYMQPNSGLSASADTIEGALEALLALMPATP